MNERKGEKKSEINGKRERVDKEILQWMEKERKQREGGKERGRKSRNKLRAFLHNDSITHAKEN